MKAGTMTSRSATERPAVAAPVARFASTVLVAYGASFFEKNTVTPEGIVTADAASVIFEEGGVRWRLPRSAEDRQDGLLAHSALRKAREVQAAEFHNEARNLQEKACRDARQTLAIAFNDVVRLKEQLGYLDQHRLSTEKAREAYRQQFDIGQRTLLDLLDTQNEYFEAGRAYTNAYYNEFVAQARTLATMGKLVPALQVQRADVPSAKDAGQDRDGMDPAELCPFDTPVLLTVDKAKAVADAPQRPRPAAAAPAAAPAAAGPRRLRPAVGQRRLAGRRRRV